MLVGHSGIRSSAHSRWHDMLVRQQAVDGAGRNALLDHPTHAEYIDYRYVRAWFHRERPVQITRRATERRFVSDNKLDAVIWLEIGRSIHNLTFVAAKSVIASRRRKQWVTDRSLNVSTRSL